LAAQQVLVIFIYLLLTTYNLLLVSVALPKLIRLLFKRAK